jgi:TolA-binding protein
VLRTTGGGAPHPVFACLILAFLAFAPAAHAQIDSREGIALHNEILELRQQMSQLQQMQSEASGGGGQSALPPPSPEGGPPISPGASGDVVAQLVVRVATLEEQLRALDGRISEVENAEHRDHDELAKQVSDLAFKLGQGGAPAPGLVPAAPAGELPPSTGVTTGMDLGRPAPTLVPGVPAQTHRAPELALKQGNAALARRDYAAAEAAAREVLALGHSPRSGDANFLLARAQAGQHEYKDAAASYYGVYKTNPRGARGAESLLGVANALIGLGDMVPACQALAKVSAEFPRPEGYVRAGVASAKKRASCH